MRFRFTSTARTLVLFSVVLSARETLSAHLYSVKDLGRFADLPGRADSRLNAINLAGKIAAGNVTNGAYGAWHLDAWAFSNRFYRVKIVAP